LLLLFAGVSAVACPRSEAQLHRHLAAAAIPQHDPCVGAAVRSAPGVDGCKIVPLGQHLVGYASYWGGGGGGDTANGAGDAGCGGLCLVSIAASWAAIWVPVTAIVFSAPERALKITFRPRRLVRSSPSGISAANSSV